jgi:IclR family transcriptional regulator, KDG regulon repressor
LPVPVLPMTAEIGTVARALRLIECFGEAQEWQLMALTKRLGLPASTTHRLLKLCAEEGFVVADGKGTYRPGLALYRLAGGLAHRFPVRQIALPLLERFAADFREVGLLTLMDRATLQMFFAAKAEPPTAMRYVIEINRLGSLAWGATGRSLLAHLTEAEIETVIARDEPSPADGARFDPVLLRRSLEEIRRDGFAITRGQRTTEGVGIAVPFFDAAGMIAGNLAATVPSFRYSDEQGHRLLAALQDLAGKMSHTFGGGC